MTALEACEPIFQKVCTLNRQARSGAGGDYSSVRADIKALLDDTMQKANSEVRLAAQMKKLELPLLFFIDSMIAESKLKFAAQWHQSRLAYERNELSGDEKFFELLDETSRDNSEEASERLAVFYACLGLGFSGMYVGQPEFLRKTMMTMAPRLNHLMVRDTTARLCGEAYDGVDTRNLVQPPGSRLVFLGLLFVICAIAVVAAYVWMFTEAKGGLAGSLEAIVKQTNSIPNK